MCVGGVFMYIHVKYGCLCCVIVSMCVYISHRLIGLLDVNDRAKKQASHPHTVPPFDSYSLLAIGGAQLLFDGLPRGLGQIGGLNVFLYAHQ